MFCLCFYSTQILGQIIVIEKNNDVCEKKDSQTNFRPKNILGKKFRE